MAQTDLLTRMANLLRANVNDLLSRAEDPVKMMNLLISDLEATIEEANEDLARVQGKVSKAKRELDDNQAKIDLWAGRAEKAARKQLVNKVRTALTEKGVFEKAHPILERSYNAQFTAQQNLETAIENLKLKLTEARAAQTSIEGTVAAAETYDQVADASKMINAAQSTQGSISHWQEAANEKLDTAQARAQIYGKNEDEDWSDLDNDVDDEAQQLLAKYAPQQEETV